MVMVRLSISNCKQNFFCAESVKVEGAVPVPSKEEQEKENKLQNKIVNSNIISAKIPGREEDTEKMTMLPPGEGVYYTLEHKTVSISSLVHSLGESSRNENCAVNNINSARTQCFFLRFFFSGNFAFFP